MAASNQRGFWNTDLRALVHQSVSVQASAYLPDVYTAFSKNGQEFMAVLENDQVVGLCSQREISMVLGSQFGRALNMRKPVRAHMLPTFTKFVVSQRLPDVLRDISSRPHEQFYNDAILVDENDHFLGLIEVRELIQLQNELLVSHIQELESKRDEIDRRNREMEQDLLMARELQLAILPDRYPEFTLRQGNVTLSLHFHYRYEPAGCVGGDFLQIIRVSDTCAGVFMCDVMGHGVRSALVTAMLRALMEELKPVAHDPGKTLTQLNQDLVLILQRPGRPMFATGLYAVFDLHTASLRVSKAGHLDALRINSAQGSCRCLQCTDDATGPALGFFADAAYGSVEFPLQPGDTLLLYTDGLIEVWDHNGEEFGEERLIELANAKRGRNVSRICDELLQSIRQFSGTGTFSDDVCIVGIEVRATNTRRSPQPLGDRP